MKKIFVALLLILNFNSYSQVFKKDIQTVMGNMMPRQGISSYSMSIKYQKKFEEKSNSDSLNGEYKFSGNMYSITMNGVESIQNNNFLVSENSQEKVLTISAAQKYSKMNFNYLILDSIMENLNYKINYKKGNGDFSYIINSTSAEEDFDSIIIKIDKNKMIFKQIIVCFKKDFRVNENYDPAQFLIMNYYNFKNEPNLDDKVFNTEKYFTCKDNRILVTKKYEKYHVVNNYMMQNNTN